MKILVIGGNRFFGRHLVLQLNDAGHNVTVANRGSKPHLFPKSISTLVVDRTEESSMRQAFANSEWDVVYDQVCYNAPQAKIANDVFGGRIGKFVFTSTASVYSNAADRSEEMFDPRSFSEGDKSDNEYQHGKRLAEKVYQSATFPVVSVRFPVVVGVDDYKMRLHWHIDRIVKEQPIFFPNIKARYSFVQSKEAAKFLFWLLSNETVKGSVNACSPEPIVLADLVYWIEERCGKKAIFASEPTDENHSPYGIESDSYLSVKKAYEHGFVFSSADDWFPILVSDLCGDYKNWVGKHT